jgi:UDP-3-O-[3-hydroxymyristoyl] glucosamine N-acyltransferase
MPSTTLSQLADLVGGRTVGPGDIEIIDALPLQDAYTGCLTLADDPRHADRVSKSTASAVLVVEEIPGCDKPMLVVERLHDAFTKIITALRPAVPRDTACGVHPSASVASTAKLGESTMVGPNATIGENCSVGKRCKLHAGAHIMAGCRIGDDCEIFPGATLYPDTRLGERVLIHAAATIGAYGFGYRQEGDRHVRTAQLGWVEIDNDVEIGAMTAVDRGTYGPTRIGEGTKIDNHVQIGHNCHIGKHNLICAHVGIAGSTSTGNYVVLAGQVGLADHIHLADRVTVAAQAGVIHDLEEGALVVGSPAGPRRQRMLEWNMLSRLPDMRKEIKALRQEVAALNAGQAPSSCDEPSRRIA